MANRKFLAFNPTPRQLLKTDAVDYPYLHTYDSGRSMNLKRCTKCIRLFAKVAVALVEQKAQSSTMSVTV